MTRVKHRSKEKQKTRTLSGSSQPVANSQAAEENLDTRTGILKWLSDSDNIILIFLILISILPLWYFKYFPSQDGPSHLMNAKIIREYHKPENAILREYYIFNTNFTPNWFIHLVLVGLLSIVPPLIAEKILMTAYIILLPISVRYILTVYGPESKFLAILSFLFIFNFPFHLGFYSFCCSLPFFFFVLGYWLKYKERFTPKRVIYFTLLVTLLFFLHISSFVLTGMAIGFLFSWRVFLSFIEQIRQRRSSLYKLLREFRSTFISTFCAFMPATVLLVLFLSQQGTDSLPPRPFSFLLRQMFSLSVVSYSDAESTLSTIISCLFLAISGYLLILKFLRKQTGHSDGLLILTSIYLYLYFTAPKAISGATYIEHRFLLYPFFTLIIWFGAQSINKYASIGIKIVAGAAFVIMIVLLMGKYAELNDYTEEYVSEINLIEPNKTILAFSLNNKELPGGKVISRRVLPFLHTSGYIALQKNIVSLNNYEADTPHFPIAYRSELNPYSQIGHKIVNRAFSVSTLEAENPYAKFSTYHERTGGRVDYVLVWGVGKTRTNDPKLKIVFDQLKIGYELIYTSPKRGLMQLYRIKSSG